MITRSRVLTPFAVVAAATMFMASCDRQISPGVYEGRSVGTAVETYTGTVQSARLVVVQEDELLQQNTIGGAVGGLTGGMLGAQVGEGWGKAAATAGGALAGAALGALAQRGAQRQNGMEYIVRMDNGQLMTVVQGVQPQIPIGRRVYVEVGSNGTARVLPAG